MCRGYRGACAQPLPRAGRPRGYKLRYLALYEFESEATLRAGVESRVLQELIELQRGVGRAHPRTSGTRENLTPPEPQHEGL